MKAQLLRIEPSRYNSQWYFTNYYYRCVECGAEYSRHQYNKRITPYCGNCQRKHDYEKAKERQKAKQEEMINQIMAKVKEYSDSEMVKVSDVEKILKGENE